MSASQILATLQSLQAKFDVYGLGRLSTLGLVDAPQKYHNKPLEKDTKSIVAGPSFLQYLNKLFQIQISAGDIIQFEAGNTSKYYMLSTNGTWDEIIKLQQYPYIDTPAKQGPLGYCYPAAIHITVNRESQINLRYAYVGLHARFRDSWYTTHLIKSPCIMHY